MDVFRILGAGARFDKKKYKQDVDLFENVRFNHGMGMNRSTSSHVQTSTAEIKAQNGTIIPSATDAYSSSAPLAPELDFFNTEKQLAESVKTESKKKVAKANGMIRLMNLSLP